MPTITSIKPQKSKKRVNIFLDGKFAFGLDLESFVKLKLKVGAELSEKKVEEIVKKAELQKVYEKMLRFASLRPRSKKEFDNWLRKHKVYESLHEELFNKLKRLEFLNDEKFATWWIEQRLQFKSKSKRELLQELRIKGITKDIIDDVFSKLIIDEEASARKLLGKNRYKWDKLSNFEARRKISAYLGRKGFSWDVIRKVTK